MPSRQRWLHAMPVVAMMITVAIAVLPASHLVNASSPLLDECIDDPTFRRGRNKGCHWVSLKPGIRCPRRVRGKLIAASCRESCDYQYCKTIQNSQNSLTVGVYYYPWWGPDRHWHEGYVRSQLIGPQQFPSLGEYDDRSNSLIKKHLDWSRKYNFGLWVTSWWGKDRQEDVTLKNHILKNNKIRNHKIAIFYETTGRIREKENYDLKNVKPDLEYLCQEYFNHWNYFTMGVDDDGNPDSSSQTRLPVLYVYITRKLEDLGLLEEVIDLMREGARDAGCGEIFIVGDQVFQGPPNTNDADDNLIPFDKLDAVTNYDVYGSMRGEKNLGYIGSREKVTKYYQEQNKWRSIARARDCAFIPAVSPGFNDRGKRPDVERIPLSRRLNENSPEGSLFQAALEEARTIVDPGIGNLIMVNSLNEWHEDTQIEPCYGVDKNGTDTSNPTDLTYSLEYKGYGGLYLKMLKEETEAWKPSMVVPPAVLSAKASVPAKGFLEDDREEYVTISDTIGWKLEHEM